ncbi:MAG: hypothetical protein JXR40_14155, partial [Pontiellaceae bacterium]|nr:hypothetical protein [Pontiellaceae bacterium]
MNLFYTLRKSVLLIATAATLLCMTGCGDKGDDKKQPDQVFEVARGDFSIVVSVQGVLDAVKRYVVEAPSISRQGLDIIEAVDDQTVLEEGDVIVKFSDESYLEELENERVEIEEAKKELTVLEQDYQVALSDIVSAIKSSADNRRQAVEAYQKYVQEDAKQEKDSLMLSVNNARKNLEDEKDNLSSLKTSLLSVSMGDVAARDRLE